MQIFPDIESLLVFSDPEFVPELDRDGWHVWCSHPRHWVLEWDLDEGVSWQLGDESNEVQTWVPGTWHVYAPGTRYRVNYRERKRRHELLWHLFVIAGATLPGVRGECQVIADPERRVAALTRQMFKVQQRGFPGHEELLRLQLQTVLAELHCASFAGPPFAFPCLAQADNPAPGGSLLARVDAVAGRHSHSPPSVESLAEALGMSTSSLCHRFKAETGWTVVQRVRWLRVQEAKRLLAGMDVKQVSRRLGFSSPCYFSRVFKETTGVSPLEFQRRP